MPRSKYVLHSLLLASVLSIAPVGTTLAFADEATDTLKKCDALASHPHDPQRYAPGVTDEQFAPGAAIEACEPAVKLNPDLARAWFELGRSYWIGQRDADAFRAFVEAAKRNYAPAMKYIGDAYLEGRGLPSGQQRDAQTALQWYKKSSAGGFSDGTAATEETEAAIQKKIADAKKEEFDPSIFQDPRFISEVYGNTFNGIRSANFIIYLHGFIKEVEEKLIFLNEGQKCPPQISGGASGRLLVMFTNAATKLATPDLDNMKNLFNSTDDTRDKFLATVTTNSDRGARDAITLFNRYGCEGAVTRTIMNNINAHFDPDQKPSTESVPSAPTSTDRIERATVTSLQLNLRDAPNSQSNVVAKMDRGLTVRILRHVDDIWVEIEAACASGTTCHGFANSKFLATTQ